MVGARYQLVVTPAPGQLVDSYAVITFGPDFVVAEGATATHPITLAQGGKVSGRVVDAGTNPIETSVTICPPGYPSVVLRVPVLRSRRHVQLDPGVPRTDRQRHRERTGLAGGPLRGHAVRRPLPRGHDRDR